MNFKMKAFLLAVMMLACTVLTCACGGGNSMPSELTYKVTVTDANGTAYTGGVIVRILKDGEQVAMVPINEMGTVEKTMATATYTVELMFTGNAEEYYYEKSGLELTAQKPELNVVLSHAVNGTAQKLFVRDEEYDAYPIGTGSTHVNLNAGKMNYFLFTPKEAGHYQFSVLGSGVEIGYYGAPHFVQQFHAAEDVVDNKFAISVKASMIGTGNTGTTVMVIGVRSSDAAEATLSIVRLGDPIRGVEDEPWTDYQATVELNEYHLPQNAQLKLFDITAPSYTLVLNETDGFYHLNTADGPLVLVNLGDNSKRQFMDSFQTIIGKSRVCKYFYDENKKFLKKESYNECLQAYIDVMDEANGVYPLTEDLKYIIQQRGEYYGWFDSTLSQYLFKDDNGLIIPGVNPEISWLFMCSYIAG